MNDVKKKKKKREKEKKEKRKHTIEGLDARKIGLPANMLAIDLTEVSNVEWILLSRIAGFDIDSSSLLLQDFKDKLSGRGSGLSQVGYAASFIVWTIDMFKFPMYMIIEI